jgi:hypothetical protein
MTILQGVRGKEPKLLGRFMSLDKFHDVLSSLAAMASKQRNFVKIVIEAYNPFNFRNS